MSSSSSDQKRLISLDLFRGISIAGMILVNNQGDWNSVYPALRHASWHGWSGADTVFPFFLFAVGASLFFSQTALLTQGISKKSILFIVVRRTTILFALGIFLNLFPFFNILQIRIPGVLQRIAICYFLASVIFLYVPRRLQEVLAFFLIFLYGGLLLFVTPGGFGSGSLEPCCNLPGFIDGYLFPGHTYENAIFPGFDPEGLLSSIPAVASTMIGVFAAGRIRADDQGFRTTVGLSVIGLVMLALGLALDYFLPINKNLWTPSYCLFMGGMASVCFSVFHWIYDLRKFRFLSVPFLALGRNAIAVYFFSSLAGKGMLCVTVATNKGALPLKTILYETLFAAWLVPRAASVMYALGFLLIWIGTMYVFYKKRLFISV
jgi:predicted acyltransferase